ncbi:MAG: response regulator transcription factor, partial [Polyangiaceae bacterium]|nr:response regulator transcription factor [Polyangiaceae bacterium]
MSTNNQPLRALVVDDEPLGRDELRFLLEQCDGVEVAGEARGANEALAACDELAPDVAFVDLRMPGPDGIALAQALRNRHPEVAVVVVSAHDDGALRAFEAQVLDYLLKPVRLERLRDALGRARGRKMATEPPPEEGTQNDSTEPLDRLAVRRKGVYVVVDIGQVAYFEVKDELVWAITADDRYALDLTLTALERRLPEDDFFRSHRGVLVRLTAIKHIEPAGSGTYELVLDHPEAPR